MAGTKPAMSPEDRLLYWMTERHNIYVKRLLGFPKPWTKDPILRTYRFCNVYRELDTVTEWIADNWRTPNSYDPDLWFAMVVARLFNLPDTLREIGYPVPYPGLKWIRMVADARRSQKLNVFNGAYIVSTNGHKMDKVEYVCSMILEPLWINRAHMRPRPYETLADYHARLMTSNGLGSFMAGQVIADLKYAHGSILHGAADWWSFAASGPGSRRGLNRVLGRAVDSPWREADWREDLTRLLVDRIGRRLPNNMPWLHAQDLQNCLCEFDKYERTRLGEGRPKSTYPGT